jgi:hypothetical protein
LALSPQCHHSNNPHSAVLYNRTDKPVLLFIVLVLASWGACLILHLEFPACDHASVVFGVIKLNETLPGSKTL